MAVRADLVDLVTCPVDFLYTQDVTVNTTLFWVEVVEISLAVNN